METRHIVRCLRSNPSSSISTIARRHNNPSRAQKPSFLLRGQSTGLRSQRSVSSIPSNRRYISTSEPEQPPKETPEAKTETPSAESSEPSPSESKRGLPNLAPVRGQDLKSNARKLGDVSDILNQLGMRKPQTQNRSNNMDSLFPETQGTAKSPSIAQLSQRVKTSLSRSDPFKPPKANLRLGPSLGRTVAVDNGRGFDATRAIRTMEGMCARNNVRHQEREQRFHLRRGQKRKDLRSKRWRKLFNVSFQKTLQRCQRMRQQGW